MVLAAGMILVAAQIPKILQDTVALLALASAEATARDLGGIITVSGAATDAAYVRYESEIPSMVYDVSIAGREVSITDMRSADEGYVARVSSSVKTGLAKTAVDAEGSFTGVRIFGVEKSRQVPCGILAHCDAFTLTAWKEE
jgi:hypothetical protein